MTPLDSPVTPVLVNRGSLGFSETVSLETELACFSLLEGHAYWSTCGRRTRSSDSLYRYFKGVDAAALYCAHRTSTFVSCAFCEQEGHLAAPFSSHPSSLVPLQGWGLIDLPLRASNEGLLRPRVARARKIISPHPLLCSGSTGPTWVSFQSFLSCAFREQEDDRLPIASLLILPAFSSGMVACLISHCARPTRGVRDRALREHRRSTGSPPTLV